MHQGRTSDGGNRRSDRIGFRETQSMTKKSLILYASMSGNTEKVAGVFEQVFRRRGWGCDTVKIDSEIDPEVPPFSLSGYDFICVGSPVVGSLPVKEMVRILSRNPASAHRDSKDCWSRPDEDAEASRRRRRFVTIASEPEKEVQLTARIKFGPDNKMGIVFVTFGGVHLGPKEALPALALLESEMEHLQIRCVGRFACPGRMGNVEGWFEDLPHRPNEHDLKKAEIFLEDILESVRD